MAFTTRVSRGAAAASRRPAIRASSASSAGSCAAGVERGAHVAQDRRTTSTTRSRRQRATSWPAAGDCSRRSTEGMARCGRDEAATRGIVPQPGSSPQAASGDARGACVPDGGLLCLRCDAGPGLRRERAATGGVRACSAASTSASSSVRSRPPTCGTFPIRRCPPTTGWCCARALCGICGSDYKQMFLNGSMDNPMTALISFPQVLGHEVVGTVERVGPGVRTRRVGERVVLNPVALVRAARHHPALPRMPGRPVLDLPQLRARRSSRPASTPATAARRRAASRRYVPAHESMCIPIPDGVRDERGGAGRPVLGVAARAC